MLALVAAAAVGIFVGFVFGTVFYVILNDPRGANRKALWWLIGLYLGIGQLAGGVAVTAITGAVPESNQVSSQNPTNTAVYLVSCTLVFLVVAIPSFVRYVKQDQRMRSIDQGRRSDALALIKPTGG